MAELPKPKELLAYGERWRPHRSVASWYMWRAAEMKDLPMVGEQAAKKVAPKKAAKKIRSKVGRRSLAAPEGEPDRRLCRLFVLRKGLEEDLSAFGLGSGGAGRNKRRDVGGTGLDGGADIDGVSQIGSDCRVRGSVCRWRSG